MAPWKEHYSSSRLLWSAVWPDFAIYWTLGNFLKPLATINCQKSPTFLGNFCKRCQNVSFFCWNHFWATFIVIWQFFLVTLSIAPKKLQLCFCFSKLYFLLRQAKNIFSCFFQGDLPSCYLEDLVDSKSTALLASVTRLGDIRKFSSANLPTKVAQKDWRLLGYLELDQVM